MKQYEVEEAGGEGIMFDTILMVIAWIVGVVVVGGVVLWFLGVSDWMNRGSH